MAAEVARSPLEAASFGSVDPRSQAVGFLQGFFETAGEIANSWLYARLRRRVTQVRGRRFGGVVLLGKGFGGGASQVSQHQGPVEAGSAEDTISHPSSC